jgi:Vitamin K-dependent gamma-carboxylase
MVADVAPPAVRPREGLTDVLRRLRDDEGDAWALALVRIGFGLLFLNEAHLAYEHFEASGFFGATFHEPFLPESLVPSPGVYVVILGAQWAAAALVVLGRWARPALLVAASLLVYMMLCDRLWFHHYRHTMAAFAVLLAFSPCERYLVPLRAAQPGPAPLWAQHAMKAQVSVMYLASGGSKLFDPDWRGGLMMNGMVHGVAKLMANRGVPAGVLDALETPLGSSLLAKGAIGTELALAALLWWPRTRRAALWVGLFFHLTISLMTSVQLFTEEMLLVYLLFAIPDVRARSLRFDKGKHDTGGLVEALDWLRRFRLDAAPGAPRLVVVGRDGRERTGLDAAAEVTSAVPLLFPLWPFVAALARVFRTPFGPSAGPRRDLRRGSPRGGP